MDKTVQNILFIIGIFAIGFLAKHLGLLKKHHASVLLRVVFYITGPAITLVSLQSVAISGIYLFLPLTAILVSGIMGIISSVTGKFFLKLPRTTSGSFTTGAMIANTFFVLPFLLAAYGEEGLALSFFYDIGNALMAFSVVYIIAALYGGKTINPKFIAKKIALSPPLLAFLLGTTLNLTGTALPDPLLSFLRPIGQATIPLTLIALGVFADRTVHRPKALVSGLLTRMGVGFVLGFIFTKLFRLSGTTAEAVMLLAGAPVGFNSLTFATMEDLDREFSASFVSISLILGIILIPLLIFFFRWL